MIPLPQDPIAYAYGSAHCGVIKLATNVAPDLKVVILDKEEEFNKQAAGMPFQIEVNPIGKD